MKQHIAWFRVLFVLWVAALFAACQSDLSDDIKKNGAPVDFGFSVRETDKVRTRAEESKDNGLDSVHITTNPYDMDFYIQLCCDNYSEVGTYVVQSGYEGRLGAKPNTTSLMWKDLTTDHTFYAWNVPWNDESEKYKENGVYEPGVDISEGLPIKFYDYDSSKEYEDGYKNNSVYKYFIGAKSAEPYNYKEHGKYVDLTFHHLVSMIKIKDFILIKTDGSIQKDLQATLTFVGMPNEAIFYPHPTTEDGRDDGRPRVVPKEPKENDDVTFFIAKKSTDPLPPATQDTFYVCPEVDFSKINFKIKLQTEGYSDYDTYYGTFDDVVFQRNPGYAYDKEEKDENREVLDSKILHAGEMMVLNITLIPGQGPGLKIIISDWSGESSKDASYHTQQGIYSDEEVKSLIDTFVDQKTYNEDEIKEKLDRLFELYGYEAEDGTKRFPLYDDVTYNSNILPIWKDYILDGQGHTITMKTNWGSNGDFKYSQTYFNVGPVRDVWFTDGTNTIYIDKEGYVWIKDEDNPGNYKKTEHQLPDLELPYKGYDISCETGIVHKTTYYNNNIIGS